MARQRLTQRPHPPRPSSPPGPSPPLRLAALVVSTVPLWFNSTPRDLVVPLYSHATVYSSHTDSLPFHALTLAAFLSLVSLLLRRGRSLPSWRTSWFLLGAYKVLTEGIVRWRDGWLVTRAVDPATGVWTGRLVLEAVPTLCLWLWLAQSWHCKERQAFLPRLFLPLAYALSLAPPLSSFLRSKLPILPECYILHPHGLLLCLIALSSSATYAPRQPRSRPPHPSSLPSRLLPRAALLALVVLAAHAVARSTAHCPTSALAGGALPAGVLAARKSTTGWITVGEHALELPGAGADGAEKGELTFRYLRADHSLLGGLWVGPSRAELRRRGGPGAAVEEREVVRRAESIYSTFILQELVRLVPAPEDLPRQSPEQGLVIGLGAGLSARALAQHGINLTLVEIDPAVYEFARDYFGVGEDVGAGEVVLDDAVRWVERQEAQGGKLFDYIIHDVFTGGAVPSTLFTLPFLTRLASLLHPSGILALNFAGTLSSASSRSILRTVLHAFTSSPSTSGHCRAIEDVPQTATGAQRPAGPDAFRNLVVFCSREGSVPLEFRAPHAGDYLAWPSPGIRRSVFASFRGQEVDLGGVAVAGEGPEGGGGLIRGEEDARRVAREQVAEVRMHWAAMREVLPREVWARW